MNSAFHPGQRWISDSEPELGLGSLLRLSTRTVTVVFPACGETREYALDNAPLRRVRFRAGDTIRNQQGTSFNVKSVTEQLGILHYQCDGTNLSEADLSDALSFDKPEDRLLAGQLDPVELFDLRITGLHQQHRRKQSAVRGFIGGRIDLIPHQLHIAAEVSSRLLPRVLLADEVGLGKTIEACLILHRLILTGRAQRVLILLPESLVHQWFVELLRRFNLWFPIFDEERCAAIQLNNPETNPFLDDQFVLASRTLFTGNEQRLQQAIDAGWDMVVVDEAHHLGWAPDSVSRDYEVVERLGRKSAGLLLLTATPEQLGMTSHFARLRLLDPARFHDLNLFIHEANEYRSVARLADKLLQKQLYDLDEIRRLAGILGTEEAEIQRKLSPSNIGGRDSIVSDLLDRHGTGRVMFRTSRATLSGFPKRLACLHPLEAPNPRGVLLDALTEEFTADTDEALVDYFKPNFAQDPRVEWLAEFLRRLGEDKVLLICRTEAKADELETSLRRRLTVKMAVFHEGLTLVQRDRHAAWFGTEDGVRILLCSEIGSEGRNFQFAHHLVLFDLPLDPELLEQRIGRLDRIGQTSEIQVHVPFVRGSAQEVLVRWFHEGLGSFEGNLHGGRELLERFGTQVHELALNFSDPESNSRPQLLSLIEETVTARRELSERLEQGRDRLLELTSFRSETAAGLVKEISLSDTDSALERFMISVFDHFNISIEEVSARTYQLGSSGVFADSFPGLPAEGMTLTCDRQKALAREDIQFLTWDHPLVTAAMDMLLGSGKGNSSFAKWPDSKSAGIYIETVYVLECIAPSALHIDRFLPPTPLRGLVDHQGDDVSTRFPAELLNRCLKNGEAYPLIEQEEFREDLMPSLLKRSAELAEKKTQTIIREARKTAGTCLDNEIIRLKTLQTVNPNVRPTEITALLDQKIALDRHLSLARVRLDSVRLIRRGL